MITRRQRPAGFILGDGASIRGRFRRILARAVAREAAQLAALKNRRTTAPRSFMLGRRRVAA